MGLKSGLTAGAVAGVGLVAALALVAIVFALPVAFVLWVLGKISTEMVIGILLIFVWAKTIAAF